MAPRSSSTRSTPGIPPRPALAKLGSRAPGSRCLPMIRTASSNVLSLLEQPPDPESRITACPGERTVKAASATRSATIGLLATNRPCAHFRPGPSPGSSGGFPRDGLREGVDLRHQGVHPVIVNEGSELLAAEVLAFQVIKPLVGPRQGSPG